MVTALNEVESGQTGDSAQKGRDVYQAVVVGLIRYVEQPDMRLCPERIGTKQAIGAGLKNNVEQPGM